MPGSVADASILGAVAFGEPNAEEAVSLLADAKLYEPTLLAYDLASIARKKIVGYPGQIESILRALAAVLGMNVRWMEVDQFAVVNLALETGLTTYDASYLYLARHLGVPLLTFDRRLAAFAPPQG